MLTEEERSYILANAYIPEHSVDLISGISGGEPFLVDDYLVHWNKGELIINGYPLTEAFDLARFESTIAGLRRRFHPTRIAYISPRDPLNLAADCDETARDEYFTLDLGNVSLPAPVRRNIRNAARQLSIEAGKSMERSHRDLAEEFIARVNPGPRVVRLMHRMPAYVNSRSGGIVLTARDERGRINAFYVVDLAPTDFATYVIGCYTKRHYITGASDLLMSVLLERSRQADKSYVHLGLGINEGLRRFKRKWGGVPSRPYRMGATDLKVPTILAGIREFLKQL